MTDPGQIALLLADVDGTLVTHDKLLTERACAAVRRAAALGVQFAVTSGRPPRGMKMLFDPLDLSTPIAGFNGGLIVDRDLHTLAERTLPDELARQAFEALRAGGVDVWIYAGEEWLVADAKAPHVDRESWTVKYSPTVQADLAARLTDVVKLVGVSDDDALMEKLEADLQAAIGDRATVARSQPYYLDITHKDANKGEVVAYLARHLGIAPARIATIGDQANDMLMFRPSGYSIAMGNASDKVRHAADSVTADSEHEGFAQAFEALLDHIEQARR